MLPFLVATKVHIIFTSQKILWKNLQKGHKKRTFATKLTHIMNYNHGRKRKIQSLVKLYSDVCEESGIKRPTVKVVLDTLWPILRKALTEGNEIRIPGFGIWQQRYNCTKVTNNVNDRSNFVVTPESYHLNFNMDPEWKQEHFEENVIIPPPEEYVNCQYPISYRTWSKIRELYGDDILRTVYQKKKEG